MPALRTFVWASLAIALPHSLMRGPAPTVPTRPLGRIVASSTEPLKSVSSIRLLPGGRVLINDGVGRRVLLVDSLLTSAVPVMDTSHSAARRYVRAGALIAFQGDSTLFVDAASLALVVIDPDGKVGRVIAFPSTAVISALESPASRTAFDGANGLVYMVPRGGPVSQIGLDGQPHLVIPDSSPVVRVNIVTRRVDTVAMLNLNLVNTSRSIQPDTAPSGHVNTTMVALRNPMPGNDDWTMLANGTIAVIRGVEFRIDWIDAAGTRTSSPKIAHEWERLTDSAKTAMVDSARVVDSTARSQHPERVPAAITRQADGSLMMGRVGGATGNSFIDPGDMPDYRPPFTGYTARSDAEGRIWVKLSRPAPPPGGPVYDVIDRRGALVDRVQIPGGTTIVGFGPGVVYLTSRVGTGAQLVKVLIH